jgi:hypothetical protein
MKKLLGTGNDKIQASLERLDQLTKDEGLSAVAQTLGIVHGIAEVVIGGALYSCVYSQIFMNTCFFRWNSTRGRHRTAFGYVSRAKQVSRQLTCRSSPSFKRNKQDETFVVSLCSFFVADGAL